jgi:hypothetical protein
MYRLQIKWGFNKKKKRWSRKKASIVTIGTGIGNSPSKCALQIAKGDTLRIFKQDLLTMIPWLSSLTPSAIVANITFGFIQRFDVMNDHDTSVKFRCNLL